MVKELPRESDDSLHMNEVGGWARDKYRLVHLYMSLFSTGMKDKWDERVYIDLYAGAGLNRIRGTGTVLAGSPVLALRVPHPFDKYIFCEEDPEALNALKERVKRIAPDANVVFINGDCNAKVRVIREEIPRASPGHTVLGLCFVDPYDLGIKFETLRQLSAARLDFLCLLALYMDANRNYALYTGEKSRKVDELMGTPDWRNAWKAEQMKGTPFPKFLAIEFSKRMETLGYIPPPFYTMKEVRSNDKNLPLYHLALFSRSQRAYDFWKEVRKYGTDQPNMFE